MRKLILTISLLGGLVPSAWCVPQVLNFQGRLLESGALVNGSRAMTFKILDAASGGNQLFAESRSVNVSTGVFNVLVGDATTGGIPLSVFDGGDRYIEVQVGAQTLPRQRVVSVGYSFRSDSASFATQAGSLLTATTAQPVVINVTQVNVTTITVTSIVASSATVTGSLRVGNRTIILGENPATGGVPNTIAFENGDAFIKTQNPSAGDLTLEAGVNKNILLSGGGNVGVGVVSPETKMHVDGVVTAGRASAATGGLKLYNSASSLATTIQAGNATTAVTYKLPPTDGLPSQVLSTDGNGNLVWRSVPSAPPPTLATVSPNSGTHLGGTAIGLTGTGFQFGVTVTIGGNPATGVTFNNGTQLSATTPVSGSAGPKDVRVINPDGQSVTLAGGFSYVIQTGGASAPFIGMTPSPFSGNLGGFAGGDALCRGAFGGPTDHWCTPAELQQAALNSPGLTIPFQWSKFMPRCGFGSCSASTEPPWTDITALGCVDRLNIGTYEQELGKPCGQLGETLYPLACCR